MNIGSGAVADRFRLVYGGQSAHLTSRRRLTQLEKVFNGTITDVE